jgi:hypothetical protein
MTSLAEIAVVCGSQQLIAAAASLGKRLVMSFESPKVDWKELCTKYTVKVNSSLSFIRSFATHKYFHSLNSELALLTNWRFLTLFMIYWIDVWMLIQTQESLP